MCAAEPLPRFDGVDGAVALLEYTGAAREMVARVKYRNYRAAIDWLGAGMAGLVGWPIDAITWAPANRGHVRKRGFDHGQLLAVSLGRQLGRTPCALLVRHDDTPLTGRTAAERSGALQLTACGEVPSSVLVVDDVITSGATIRAAARVLRRAGAHHVFGVSAAYTPPPGN